MNGTLASFQSIFPYNIEIDEKFAFGNSVTYFSFGPKPQKHCGKKSVVVPVFKRASAASLEPLSIHPDCARRNEI